MTDAELLAASIPAACDLLEERGLDAVAGLLRTAPGLLEAAVVLLEEEVRTHFHPGVDFPAHYWWQPRLALIAAHRGESPESALARLAPIQPSYGARDWPTTEASARRTVVEVERAYDAELRRFREVEARVYGRAQSPPPPPGRPLVDVLAGEPGIHSAGHVACRDCGRVRPHPNRQDQPPCPDCGCGATVPHNPPAPHLTPDPRTQYVIRVGESPARSRLSDVSIPQSPRRPTPVPRGDCVYRLRGGPTP